MAWAEIRAAFCCAIATFLRRDEDVSGRAVPDAVTRRSCGSARVGALADARSDALVFGRAPPLVVGRPANPRVDASRAAAARIVARWWKAAGSSFRGARVAGVYWAPR